MTENSADRKNARETERFLLFDRFFIRLLTVVGQPFAFRQRHIGKYSLEGRILRGAGVDAEADFSAALPHMANPHLGEMDAVGGAFDAVVVLPPAESVPHGLDFGINTGKETGSGRFDRNGCIQRRRIFYVCEAQVACAKNSWYAFGERKWKL